MSTQQQEQPPPSYEQATAPTTDNSHAVSTDNLTLDQNDCDEKSGSLTALTCCSALASVAECCFIWYILYKLYYGIIILIKMTM